MWFRWLKLVKKKKKKRLHTVNYFRLYSMKKKKKDFQENTIISKVHTERT